MLFWSGEGTRVYKTDTVRCTGYLIETESSCVLIDTSMPFERGRILRGIRQTRRGTIDGIFLTHSHSDHAANAHFLSERTRCPVYVSAAGLESVRRGVCVMPKGTTPFGRLLYRGQSALPFDAFTHYAACPDARELTDGVIRSYLGEKGKLLATPGHTADSVSLLLNSRIAFVGDAMVNRFGSLFPPFADQEAEVRTSWKRLLETPCEWFCPAHGRPLKREKLMKAYESL